VGLILWLVVGGIVGWLASLVMRTDAQQGILLNVIVGIVGALIAGLVFGGTASINNVVSLQSILISLLGATALLAVVNLVKRGTAR